MNPKPKKCKATGPAKGFKSCGELSILKMYGLCSNCHRKWLIYNNNHNNKLKQRMNYKENYFKHHGLDKCDVLLCKVCGNVAVNLHHVIYKSQCGTDDPENLIPLCYKCHSGHHDNNNPTTEQLKDANRN